MIIEAIKQVKLALGRKIHSLNDFQRYDSNEDKSAIDELTLFTDALKHKSNGLLRIVQGPTFLNYKVGLPTQSTAILKVELKNITDDSYLSINNTKLHLALVQSVQDIINLIDKTNLVQAIKLDDTTIGLHAIKVGSEQNIIKLDSSDKAVVIIKQMSDGNYGDIHKSNLLKVVITNDTQPILLDSGLDYINTIQITKLHKIDNIYTNESIENLIIQIYNNRYIYIDFKTNKILTDEESIHLTITLTQ